MRARRSPATGAVGRASEVSGQQDLLSILPDAADKNGQATRGVTTAAERRDRFWWDGAMRAVETMAATGRQFSAYDVAEAFGLPDPDHPNRWGALLSCAARAEVVECVGAAPSRRPSVEGSLARVWRGTAAFRASRGSVGGGAR